jgi:hypothetical protein
MAASSVFSRSTSMCLVVATFSSGYERREEREGDVDGEVMLWRRGRDVRFLVEYCLCVCYA